MKIFKFGILVFGFLISSSMSVHANGLVRKITDGWIEKDRSSFWFKIDLTKTGKPIGVYQEMLVWSLCSPDKSENVLAAKIIGLHPLFLVKIIYGLLVIRTGYYFPSK